MNLRMIRELAGIRVLRASIVDTFMANRAIMEYIEKLPEEDVKAAIFNCDVEFFFKNAPPELCSFGYECSISNTRLRELAQYFDITYARSMGNDEILNTIIRKYRKQHEDSQI